MVTLSNRRRGEDSLPTERGGWLLLTPVTLLRERFAPPTTAAHGQPRSKYALTQWWPQNKCTAHARISTREGDCADSGR